MAKLKTHWVADIFPINQSDVEALAESIKRNGQRVPILALPDGRVVDGRNRWLACEIAGVEPIIETLADDLTDEQLVDLSADLNAERRDLLPGQRAAAAAAAIDRLYRDEGAQQGRGKTGNKRTLLGGSFKAGHRQIENALTLLRNHPVLFNRLRNGEAVATVYAEYKTEKDGEEKRARLVEYLQKIGFADQVAAGKKTIEELVAEANASMAEEENKRNAEIINSKCLKGTMDSWCGTLGRKEAFTKAIELEVIDKAFIKKQIDLNAKIQIQLQEIYESIN